MGSRQNSYWISLSVMLTNVQTHTHTYRHADTDTQTHRHTDSLLVPGFLHHVNRIRSPQEDHKIQISLRQFKPKVTELQVKSWIIVIGKHSQQQTRSSQKRSITSTPQCLHFTGPQPTGISRFPRRNVRTIYNVWIRRRQEHATSLKSQTSLIHCYNTQSHIFWRLSIFKETNRPTGRWAERQTGRQAGRRTGRDADG